MRARETRRFVFSLCACLAVAAAEAAPSVVIDVASGQILEQEQPTQSWYPASLTKLMTVYVALDAVRSGRLSYDTPLVVSPRAVSMAPSKMGFPPGSEVTLRHALVMLMVKSANDVAVTIAEGVSGSVEGFADEMNRASAKLGMRESYWVNPNGLPDERQVTSARDLALLGRALLVEFPESAGFFNIGAMKFGNQIHPTHNGLLGRYPGADGMKTGFTCPAGYNLVASATHGGQKLIAVVLGAPSAAARTAKAAALLDKAFTSGSPSGALASLPTFGVAAAPDMRDSVCRHRGKASAEYMAEVEDMTIAIPLENGATGAVDVKTIAQLPRPRFEPTPVRLGREPGYEGPVAGPRDPGSPVGSPSTITAFAPEKPALRPSPIGRPAPDALSLRRPAGRKAVAHAPAAHPSAAKPSAAKPSAAKPSAAKPSAAKHHSPAAKARPVKAIATKAEKRAVGDNEPKKSER
ncbi:D-alanyl-D-alanine carboxypeptidase family protein [Methylosinus sp. Sm6]|uniref:D-alanyl-D-alanine carboxypeptidase family protein n=1 Tax=Methylosinus sp. Sm6 TaxID=2866948 RepID=UPI001C9A0078|nr:D-alanyl-D-alanine carboxypeptidase family protein [Methylosinus sp. Sm6]MBY6242516.1 serine hydrolase [Methylosinus sp. Sm6]